MSNNTQPEIRFPGFTEDWEQRKLGELAESFEYGLNASAKKFDGSNKYIRITDIDDISHKFNQSGVTSPDIDFASADNYKLKKGDILFARTGASVGKTYMYRESDGLVYYAGFLIRARIKSKISSEFVFQTTFTDSYNRFIKITSQRSGQPGVNAEEYSNFKIMIPNYEEQNAIGCFFKKIDDTITLHQRKLDLLKETKKGFLQKMFPKNGAKVPEIRFSGFTEDWEQRKLGEIVQITMGQSPNSENYTENPEDYILVQGNADMKNNRVVPRVWTTQITKQAEKGDLILSVRAPVGDIGKTDYDVVLGRGVAAIKGNDFIFQQLGKMKESGYWNRFSTGSTFESINSNDIREALITIPTGEEQQKIGTFFKQLDDTIALHQRKLDLLKETKKGFLQKMFV
ncbi:restriction endonuclease subunit S [Enterococcus faecium]|uniref:restriction endonuclease subunit S n=1 Tax=Enterococcus faecium TaxID=1352 RepID=UPI00178177F3|nr:restriction endonuclease subunit S [Enterococcus faecium]MBD9911905.1 restriction endonuclease subunit S [Enterococcus faecium]MDQ8579126.1 restriction endonuclease subunit S [Enterococcus faecium]